MNNCFFRKNVPLTQAAVTYFYLRSCLFTRLQHCFNINKELQTLPDHLISLKCFYLFSVLVVSTMLSWYLFSFVSPMHSLCFDVLLRSSWKITIYYALVFYNILHSMHFTLFKAEWWSTAVYINVFLSLFDSSLIDT